MRCGKNEAMQQLALFSLDASNEDPVGQQAIATLQIGRKGDGRGPIAADCYDIGQDLLAFVHARRTSLVSLSLLASLYLLASQG